MGRDDPTLDNAMNEMLAGSKKTILERARRLYGNSDHSEGEAG